MLFVYNVAWVVDVLDEDDSDMERFDTGMIMSSRRYSFFDMKLLKEIVFKIPQDPLEWPYVTDPFV